MTHHLNKNFHFKKSDQAPLSVHTNTNSTERKKGTILWMSNQANLLWNQKDYMLSCSYILSCIIVLQTNFQNLQKSSVITWILKDRSKECNFKKKEIMMLVNVKQFSKHQDCSLERELSKHNTISCILWRIDWSVDAERPLNIWRAYFI